MQPIKQGPHGKIYQLTDDEAFFAQISYHKPDRVRRRLRLQTERVNEMVRGMQGILRTAFPNRQPPAWPRPAADDDLPF